MSFGDDLRLFAEKVEQRTTAVFHGCTEEVQTSVVDGSLLTTAPGQPVDTGTLKGSFIPTFVSPTLWQTTTNLEYAPAIEEGIQKPYGRAQVSKTGIQQLLITPSPMTLRSKVGGFHSVKLTRGGWGRIVDAVRNDVVDDG